MQEFLWLLLMLTFLCLIRWLFALFFSDRTFFPNAKDSSLLPSGSEVHCNHGIPQGGASFWVWYPWDLSDWIKYRLNELNAFDTNVYLETQVGIMDDEVNHFIIHLLTVAYDLFPSSQHSFLITLHGSCFRLSVLNIYTITHLGIYSSNAHRIPHGIYHVFW